MARVTRRKWNKSHGKYSNNRSTMIINCSLACDEVIRARHSSSFFIAKNIGTLGGKHIYCSIYCTYLAPRNVWQRRAAEYAMQFELLSTQCRHVRWADVVLGGRVARLPRASGRLDAQLYLFAYLVFGAEERRCAARIHAIFNYVFTRYVREVQPAFRVHGQSRAREKRDRKCNSEKKNT